MFTRDEFARSAARATAIEKRRQRILALFAVPVGILQVPLLHILENNFGAGLGKHMSLVIFLIYFGIVVMMIVQMNKAIRQAAPACGACGAPLRGVAERVAIAAGKCDRCGAQVIE